MYLSRKRQRISGRAAVLATIYLPQSVRTPPQGKAPWRPRTLTLGALSALEASLAAGQAAATQQHLIYKCSQVANHYSQRCPEIFQVLLFTIVIKKGSEMGPQRAKVFPFFETQNQTHNADGKGPRNQYRAQRRLANKI